MNTFGLVAFSDYQISSIQGGIYVLNGRLLPMIPLSLLLALLIKSRVVGPLVTSRNNGLLIYIVKFLEITKVISSEMHRGVVATA
jgi:hypothetical protein